MRCYSRDVVVPSVKYDVLIMLRKDFTVLHPEQRYIPYIDSDVLMSPPPPAGNSLFDESVAFPSASI